MTNIKEMVQKFQNIGVTMVVITDITYTRKVELRMLDDVHMKLVNLSKRTKRFLY